MSFIIYPSFKIGKSVQWAPRRFRGRYGAECYPTGFISIDLPGSLHQRIRKALRPCTYHGADRQGRCSCWYTDEHITYQAPYITQFVLNVGDYAIPEGTSILVLMLALHRNPRLYPDPLVYNPERFLPDQCEGRHPCAYIPFCAGPRNCIGISRIFLLKTKVLKLNIGRSKVRYDGGESCVSHTSTPLQSLNFAGMQEADPFVGNRVETSCRDGTLVDSSFLGTTDWRRFWDFWDIFHHFVHSVWNILELYIKEGLGKSEVQLKRFVRNKAEPDRVTRPQSRHLVDISTGLTNKPRQTLGLSFAKEKFGPKLTLFPQSNVHKWSTSMPHHVRHWGFLTRQRFTI